MNNIQKFKILNENQFSHKKGNSSSDELFPLEKNNICIKALNSTKQIQKSNETEKQNITSKNKSEKNRKLIPTLLKEKQKDKLLFGNYIGIENPKKCGNVFCFYYIKKYPLFTLGPQFYYALLLFFFINLLFIFCIILVYVKYNIIFLTVGILIYIFVISSQLYTTFINQGIPQRKWFLSDEIIFKIINDDNFYKKFNSEDYKVCKRCNILIDKKLKIVHCDICNICCEYYDHHCTWIGKCIGKKNLLSFKIFVYSTIIFILYNMSLTLNVFINIFMNYINNKH